jgi:hypothetical protein
LGIDLTLDFLGKNYFLLTPSPVERDGFPEEKK